MTVNCQFLISNNLNDMGNLITHYNIKLRHDVAELFAFYSFVQILFKQTIL